MQSRPNISVIVPHFRQFDALERCLKSLAAQSFPAADTEVIVVDNNSGDRTRLHHILKALPAARLVQEKKKGAAHARNAGLAVASGKAIGFIDADCVADPDWIVEGLRALGQADLVGGEIIVTVADEAAPSGVELFERVFAFRQRIYIKRKQFSVTANLFATREAALAIGSFKNAVAEDVDWCRRAGALGFRLAFNDTSIISHPARRNWSELTNKWDRLISERWNGYGGRSWIRRIGWAGLAVATALSAVPHLAKVLFSDRIKGMRDRTAAAGVLTRIRFWRAQRMLTML